MTPSRSFRSYLLPPLGVLALAAFGPGPRPKPVHSVVVVATDYAFQAPDTLPAGVVEFRLHNMGPSLHHVTLFRLEEGKTLKDLLAAMAPNAPFPAWAVPLGGPNASIPGGWSNATLALLPGRYAMLCVIPDTTGILHLAHGMVKEFVVEGANRGKLPRADRSLVLDDYSFTWSSAPKAGKQVWMVTNRGPQLHEVVIARLGPGKSAQDLVSWVGGGLHGPPPGAPIGGVTMLAPGESNTIALDLPAGRYALVCFVPDAKDGKDHATHGMVREFEVRGKK